MELDADDAGNADVPPFFQIRVICVIRVKIEFPLTRINNTEFTDLIHESRANVETVNLAAIDRGLPVVDGENDVIK